MVPKTREQIESEHKIIVQNIRASYHEKQEISHEEYHSQLNAENDRYETEIATHFPPKPVRDPLAEIDKLTARLDKAGITQMET